MQRAAVAQQRIHSIRTDNDEVFDIESVRALRELEVSTAMNEDRTQERKHGLRTPQDEEDYMVDTLNRIRVENRRPAANGSRMQTPSHLSGANLNIVA